MLEGAHNDAYLLAHMRALEQAASLQTAAAAAAAAGSDPHSAFSRAPRVTGLTRTHSAPLPLQLLPQHTLWLQRQAAEERLRQRANPSSHYIKQVRAHVLFNSGSHYNKQVHVHVVQPKAATSFSKSGFSVFTIA